MSHCWRLDDGHQTLVLATKGDLLPQVVYWGKPLPTSDPSAVLAEAHQQDFTGGMLDGNPDLSLCPEASQTFPGQPGLRCRNTQGALLQPKFRFLSAEESANDLVLTYQDTALGITYEANFALTPQTGLITAWARLTSTKPIWLQWLAAPVFPAPQNSSEMLDVSGRWIGEFQINTVPWSAGIHLRESRTGRSGHEHFPGLVIPESGTNNTTGQAYGFHYGWSGGHKMIAEELPDGRRQVQFGNATDSELTSGLQYETAKLYAVFSDQGLNGCAVAFQRHLRDHIVKFAKAAMPRPVHYNCWEAIYFDHDISVLKQIATKAKSLGAERFVLDDGWFVHRDDDTTSLGDWQIDSRKYPDGLGPIVDHVSALGMQFGLWFEPEMVSPNSTLYRAHPDWVLGPTDQLLGRKQMVLDMGLQEVSEYLFNSIAALLRKYDITYIKWDHNRVLPISDADQTRASYALLARLQIDFPHVEIETCASGGGRIDFGILNHTQRVWLSDSNDALERSRIQHGAALFLPSAVTGSHVGPRQCHTTGRVFNMEYRAWVAAQRHMGFEMDPSEISDLETQTLSDITQWYKDNRKWMMQADILRLDSSDPSVIAEMQLARDRSRFVVFSNQLETSAQINPRPLRLTQLDPDDTYIVELKNRGAIHKLSRGNPLLKSRKLQISGAWLMAHGLNLPYTMPSSIWVVEGKKLSL